MKDWQKGLLGLGIAGGVSALVYKLVKGHEGGGQSGVSFVGLSWD